MTENGSLLTLRQIKVVQHLCDNCKTVVEFCSDFSYRNLTRLLRTGETQVICKVCYCPFNESKSLTPHLLDCGHTLCYNCLSKMKKESVIECPFDRKLTPVMHGEVSSLRKNYALISVYSEGSEGNEEEIVGDLADSQTELYSVPVDDVEAQNSSQHVGCLTGCKPRTEHQARACHALGLMVLMGNMFFDWLVKVHVDKLVHMLMYGSKRNSPPVIESLKEVHLMGLNWYAIKTEFLVFAIFTTVVFILQFFGTMLIWCFSSDNKMVLQKMLIWTSLILNDLPQCILTVIISYATDDAYLPYLGSTVLGVLGQYLLFYALSNTEAFHYPKVICLHGLVVAVCFVTQVAFITKSYVVQ